MSLQLSGRLDLAEQLYRAILQAEPKHSAANYCIGMLHVQIRRPADGLPFLRVALTANPEVPDYWLGYLEALLLSGRILEAKTTLARARQQGLDAPAAAAFAKRLDSAAPARSARRRESRLAETQERALLATLKQGDLTAARAEAESLTERFPERGLPWKVLGALLWADGWTAEALDAMQTSVRLSPKDAEAHSNLGLSLAKLQRFDEAEASLGKALALDPHFATAHYRLGMTYSMQARLPEAEASLRRGISCRSSYAAGDDELNHSNLLFILSHNAALDADALFAEHCRFGEFFESPLRASWPRHANGRDPDRRLKIGLVSGDLREHAVASFIEPLLAQLRNHSALELHAYHNSAAEDHVSRRLRGLVRSWHPVCTLSDAALTNKIMDDGIDILIDLSGHTGLNRLPAFMRKPAPIQASWIGYPGTTGLRAMDYYLADRHLLPPGEFERYFTEKLVYLPGNVPFQPHDSAPPVNELPALASGLLTFGSFNRPDKINGATIQLWSRLLCELPNTRMLLGGIPRKSQHGELAAQFAAHGIARERLTFHPPYDMRSYLELHHQVDLCLDTSPYNGGTTTFHALWMGVPTMTLAGPTPASRSGAAILAPIGLHEFIATSAAEFVQMSLHWANHLSALAQVRAGTRERLQCSPGRQADVIAAALDAALRHMWRRWCAGQPPASFQTTGAGVLG
jgi:predicted O-linked N-acetylglucosamine transferase (SPINDLY family)